MDETKPPSYDAVLSGGFIASAPSIDEISASDIAEKPAHAPYENEGYEPEYGDLIPPTAPPPAYTDTPPILLPNFNILTNAAIRTACYDYVKKNSLYGSKAIRDMIISSINSSVALHYRLETFGEKRRSRNRIVPYRGQHIDGPENGPEPGPWDVSVESSGMFQDGEKCVEIPHTAVVNECWKCDGCKKMDCPSCEGRGSKKCPYCNGNDLDRKNYTCLSCRGTGRKSCVSCNGSRKTKCVRCEGSGKLKHYKELIVIWKNHVDECVTNAMNLPIDLVLQAADRQIFIEECPVVSPISHSPDVLVNDASREFIYRHRMFANELVIMQRQTLRAIPITKVTYSWRRKEGEFYVYSCENKVYFENYPQKYSCCIS